MTTKKALQKSCVSCGTTYQTSDVRQKYCTPGCRQEAYRVRHGIPMPAFLDPKGSVGAIPKKRIITRQIDNPQYTELKQQIKQIESQLDYFEYESKDCQEEEAKLLYQDDELLTGLTTGGIAAGVFVGVMLGAAAIKTMIEDKKNKDRLVLIAMLVALGLAALMAAASHSGIKEKRKRKKLRKLEELKLKAEQASALASTTSAELAARKVHLKSLPEHISKQEAVTYYEQTPDGSEQVSTLDDLSQKQFNPIKLSQEFVTLFGEPDRGFAMAVHGASGQGKSTWTVDLAKDLANHQNKVLFVAAEEGLSKSLQRKFEGYRSPNIMLAECRNLTTVREALRRSQYDAVVLDSVQELNIRAEQLRKLRTTHPQTSFIYILQATKAGAFKGDNAFAHDSQITIKVEKRVPIVEKTRFK